MIFEFAQPVLLLLAIPSGILLWLLYRRSLSDFPLRQRQLSLAVRGLLLVLLLCSAAGMTLLKSSTTPWVVFVTDISRSIGPEGRKVAAEFLNSAEQVRAGRFSATGGFARIAEVQTIIICVPTPLNKNREPDISYIVRTGESIAPHLQKGTLVVLESTTYPGTTDEVVQPALEDKGLKFLLDKNTEQLVGENGLVVVRRHGSGTFVAIGNVRDEQVRHFRFLAEDDFDAVVLDLGVPTVDGLSVLKRWRAERRDMPVLVLTARSRWGDKIAGFEAGADEALMLDPRGFVASCNSTNFFIVRGAEIWTSTSLYSFKGITQANVIAAWRGAGPRAWRRPLSKRA